MSEDNDEIYKYTSNKLSLWKTYQTPREDIGIGNTLLGAAKSASYNVGSLSDQMREYMEKARSVQRASRDMGISEAIKPQLAIGQSVEVYVTERRDNPLDIEIKIYRSGRAVMSDAESKTSHFPVIQPSSICFGIPHETETFNIPTIEGSVNVKLDDRQFDSIRTDRTALRVPALLQEMITSVPTKAIKEEEVRAVERRACEQEEEEIRSAPKP